MDTEDKQCSEYGKWWGRLLGGGHGDGACVLGVVHSVCLDAAAAVERGLSGDATAC